MRNLLYVDMLCCDNCFLVCKIVYSNFSDIPDQLGNNTRTVSDEYNN